MRFNNIFISTVENPKIRNYSFSNSYKRVLWDGTIHIKKGTLFYINYNPENTLVYELNNKLEYESLKPYFGKGFEGFLDAKNYLTDLNIRPISKIHKSKIFINKNFQHCLDNI
jgi:hypothetical protein